MFSDTRELETAQELRGRPGYVRLAFKAKVAGRARTRASRGDQVRRAQLLGDGLLEAGADAHVWQSREVGPPEGSGLRFRV